MDEIAQRFIEKADGFMGKQEINRLKNRLSRELGLASVPTNVDISSRLDSASRQKFAAILSTKPTRDSSGVNALAIMTKPIACPHGKCTYCPGGPGSVFGDVPQSYTGNEPASMRAIRNHFDPYLQVMSRLEQYAAIGKLSGKIELIIMGGTFPSFDMPYQDEFITGAFQAMNDFSTLFFDGKEFRRSAFNEFFELPGSESDSSRVSRIQSRLIAHRRETALGNEILANEHSAVRAIALCIETKPDWCLTPHINQMLRLGTTRVELGIQALSDDILRRTNRGHTLADSIESTRLLKDSFLKVGYHMMPGQPGSTPEMDSRMLRELFENPDYRPDALKVYPCLVMPGTPLYAQWKRGEFRPMETPEAARIIAEAKRHVPRYCRIMRIQRDIPTKVTAGGVDKTNLRQLVSDEMKLNGWRCSCIRCREPRWSEVDFDSVKLNTLEYESSAGTELFLSIDDTRHDLLLGYLRLRIPSQPFRPEIPAGSAGIRELHVFGQSVAVGATGTSLQHKGFGTRLVAEAERIAKERFDSRKMLVISGVGARDYYRRKLGYADDGAYVSKVL